MTRENFIKKVVNELLDEKFSINLVQQPTIQDCSGFFDPNLREFAVALKNKCSFETIIHEYSHFLQWKHRKRFFNSGVGGTSILFAWIAGKNYPKYKLDEALERAIVLEWDCELSSLELINKYNLDVNKNDYCRAANCYLFYYHMLRETRQWYSIAPWTTKIVKTMPPCIQPIEFYLDAGNITAAQRDFYLKNIIK